MITRRNIRSKVLHTLFEHQIQYDEWDLHILQQKLEWRFKQTESLHSAIWHLLIQISDYVLTDASIRGAKRLPTAEDLNVNTKLADNILLLQLKRNNKLSESIKSNKIATLFDQEFVRTLFQILKETPEYQHYVLKEGRLPLEEKEILKFILDTLIFGNEITQSFLSEQYITLETDIEMMQSWIDKVLMNTGGFSFHKLVTADKYEYAFELMKCHVEKLALTREIITPKLLNWDPDRVAILDFIILQLGVCEMLFFNSIPLKVTINEYIDIAKYFSGMQSGQFVNGLLDSIRKDLEQQNRIHKVEYKPIK
jgi:transcription antitermination protein NusB